MKKSFIFAMTMGFATVNVFALGIKLTDQDAYATARGNAFVATADNPAAVYYNPAGITQLEGENVRLGGYGISITSKFTPPGGSSFENKDEIHVLPQFYYTFSPAKSAISLGLGAYSPYGLSIEYPDTSVFRTLARKSSIKYFTLSPVIGLQVSKTFSIGFGPAINYAEAELHQGIIQPGDDFSFKGSDISYSFIAGLLWQPTPQHSFGLTYHGDASSDFSGHSSVRTKDFTFPTPFGPFTVPGTKFEEDANAKFHFPQTIVAGYSFRPTPDWNIELNVDWTDWETLDTVTLHQQNSANIGLPFNWRSSFMYEAGVTRKFAHGFSASAGYMYAENSVPESSFNPSVPDSNHHVFSAGVGQRTGRFNWDLAYQFTYGPTRNINNGTLADGTYRFNSHAITLSAGLKF